MAACDKEGLKAGAAANEADESGGKYDQRKRHMQEEDRDEGGRGDG